MPALPYTRDFFAAEDPEKSAQELSTGAWLLRGFVGEVAAQLLSAIDVITAAAPLRHLVTPGGFRMSVAMTNCGSLGWVSDRQGYRYQPVDPLTEKCWPRMPALFLQLAKSAAAAAGYRGFEPNACLINRYDPGARLTLHQDKDERDFDAPIVSVSLGLSAVFLFGGNARSDRHQRIHLHHGDVIVWGGPARLFHHGILPLKAGYHEAAGSSRLNLTFRRA
jgi:DNA oxidative demethylase